MPRAANITAITLSSCFSGGRISNFRRDLSRNLIAFQVVNSECKCVGEASDWRLRKIQTLFAVEIGSFA